MPTGPSPRRTTMRQPSRRRSEPDFDAWLTTLTERTDPVMAWLGVLFALLVGFQLTVHVRPPVGRALDITGWVIWAVFVVDFGIKFVLAPAKGRFLRRHWLQAVCLLLPTLRLFSFLRLMRLGRALPAARVLSTSYRSVGTARRLLQSRLGYLGGLATVVTVALAELVYLFERRPGGALRTFPDALVWAGSVVVGMQADPVPTTRSGQLVMLAGFATGLVLVASLAGSLGAFLLQGPREHEAGGTATGGPTRHSEPNDAPSRGPVSGG
jgi:voltage-gated potassium channel